MDVIYPMSYLSNALQAAVSESGHDQGYWAAQLRMDPSQFNKYMNGRAPAGAAVLTALLGKLPATHHAKIVRGYALDRIPSEFVNLVEVYTRDGIVAESRSDGLDDLPEDVRATLRFLGSKCHERPVLDMLRDLERLLRAEK